jgi:hypothetical protein
VKLIQISLLNDPGARLRPAWAQDNTAGSIQPGEVPQCGEKDTKKEPRNLGSFFIVRLTAVPMSFLK